MKKIRLLQDWQFWKADGQKQQVQLPHDAMLLETRVADMENGSSSGYYPGGKYYYAKTVFGDEEYAGKKVMLEFEGVYMDSTVWLNGEKVGGWIYGYTNFFVDLTGKLRIGEDNEILVEIDNSLTPNSRWYSGSGIYRPVNLWVGGGEAIKPQGLLVKTLSIQPAVVELRTLHDGCGEVAYTVYDGNTVVAHAQGQGVQVQIPDAKLWSAETPHLYTVKAVLSKDGTVLDEATERFGVRTLSWDAKSGLQVNGQTVKLRGGCIHHDNGILGACSYDKAEHRKIRKLKEFGFNAIRYSHYPAGKTTLDACDELGMYVMDESFDQWRRPNTRYDYSIHFDAECEKDIAALAWKDYNHPCVIMYCIGNEILDTGRSYAADITRKLTGILRRIDGTRPITIANNAGMSGADWAMERFEKEKGVEMGSIQFNELVAANPDYVKTVVGGGFTADKLEALVGPVFDQLDIAGHNYAHDLYEGIHECRQDRILLSAETFPCRMASNWKTVLENDHIIGDFHWTAWDYLGEAGVGLPVYGTKEAPFAKPYPCLTAACGSFDLNGNPEAAAYYAAVMWGAYEKPYIAVRPVDHSGEEYTVGGWRLTDAIDCWSWDGCEGKNAQITVYSIGREVALYQDGVLVERKPLLDWKADFETVYRPGMLEAVSYDENGSEIARAVLKTVGQGICLAVLPEEMRVKAHPEEIVFVNICITDDEGNLRMMTDKKITVAVEGEGTLLALGSARPETEEHFHDGSYTSWHGTLLAAVRCTGKPGVIRITASAEGCQQAQACIVAE